IYADRDFGKLLACFGIDEESGVLFLVSYHKDSVGSRRRNTSAFGRERQEHQGSDQIGKRCGHSLPRLPWELNVKSRRLYQPGETLPPGFKDSDSETAPIHSGVRYASPEAVPRSEALSRYTADLGHENPIKQGTRSLGSARDLEFSHHGAAHCFRRYFPFVRQAQSRESERIHARLAGIRRSAAEHALLRSHAD